MIPAQSVPRSLPALSVALTLVSSALPNAPLPPRASRILVMPFAAAVTGDAPARAGASLWIGQGVAWLLSEDLAARGLPALSRDETARAFDRLKLPFSASLTRATMLRVGELLGATQIVFGDVTVGDEVQVRARLIQVAAGELRPEVTAIGAFDGIFALAQQVGDGLASALGRPPDALTPRVAPMPPDVFENYMKGQVAATPAAQQRFLESALKQTPRDARVLVALWSVYTAEGAHDKALAIASAVPRDSPLSREARFFAVLSLIDLGRLTGAFQELTALYAERPAAAVSNALGVVQLRRGSGATGPPAVEFFTRAAREDPGNPDYLFNVGYASALADDSSSALDWLRESVRLAAANGDAHIVMSAVLAGTGHATEAGRELELARLLGTSGVTPPDAPTSDVPAGLARLRTDLDTMSFDRVDVGPDAATQRDQADAAAFEVERGRRLMAAGNDREAMTALRRAAYLAPYSDESHLLLGQLYQRGGRLQDAIDEFKVAIWCRETVEGRVALGAALLDAGDRDGARREAQRAIALNRESPEARALLAKIDGGTSAVLPSHRFHG